MASEKITLPDAPLADIIAALLDRFKIRAILREMDDQSAHGDMEAEIRALDLVETEELFGEISDEDQEMIDEAEELFAALRDADADMRAGRRDDARHRLYMRLPRDCRDIFHPECGLKV